MVDDKKLASLVRQAIKGNMAAFEEVYFENARSVLYHVRSQIIDKENYQDVAQDVAISLWKNIKSLRDPRAFRSWMHQIIRTTCADHNRTLLKERSRQSFDNTEETMDDLLTKSSDKITDPALLTTQKDDNHRLFAAIETLPPAYREAVILRYYDDFSYKEIAKVLNISTSSVGTNIMRGMEHLKEALGSTGEIEIAQGIKEKQREKVRAVSHHKGGTVDEKYNGGLKTGTALTGAAILLDEESIKSSLDEGIGEVIPSEVVEIYTKDTHLNLIGLNLAAAAAVAPVASKTAATGIVAAVSLLLTAFAVVVGVYGYSISGVPQELPWTTTKTTTETAVHYNGDPLVVFANEKGEDSPYGVVHIALVDSVAIPATISWTVNNPAGEEVLAGTGAEITDDLGLSLLLPGEYKVNFTLTDDQGASALCYRTFTIEE